MKPILAILAVLTGLAAGQNIASDPGSSGPPLEIVHLFYGQMPNAVAVNSEGRIFCAYPSGLDANNTNGFQVAELTSNTTETPYPNAQINSPPGGRINYTTYPPTGVNYENYFINAMSVAVDPVDRLWVLDNGRPLTPNGTLVDAVYGGPKLVAINTTSNTVALTVPLPITAAYPDSYLNDVRIDLRPNITASGKGVAYVTDSSSEGRNGLVIVDLGTLQAWRHLDGFADVRAQPQFFRQVWGEPVYYIDTPGEPYSYDPTGADGLGFTDDGDTLYWSVTGSRYLYSIPTVYLRNNSKSSEVRAQAAVVSHGQKGSSDGLMQDTNNYIYAGSFEQNAINIYNPANGSVSTYVRDPRIGWTDSMWISNEKYLYFIENQLWRTPSYYPGTDRRVKPYVLYRVPTADGGDRVSPM